MDLKDIMSMVSGGGVQKAVDKYKPYIINLINTSNLLEALFIELHPETKEVFENLKHDSFRTKEDIDKLIAILKNR